MKKTRTSGGSRQQKKGTKPRSVNIDQLSPEAQEWLQEAVACLKGNNDSEERIHSGAADDSRLVAGLAQLPSQEIPPVVQQLARETGDLVLPLLQHMTFQEEPTLTLSAAEALGFISELEAAVILSGIQRKTSDKTVRKAARRSLMRLKSHGLEVDDFLVDSGESFDITQLTPDTTSAWVSNVDGAGNQMVIFAKTVPMEGPYAVHVITNDQAGIESCLGGRTTRGQMKLVLEDITGEGQIQLEKADPDYARHLIQQALNLHRTADTPLPQEYHSLSFLLGDMEEPIAGPDVYSLVGVEPASVEAEDATTSRNLLKSPEFASWLLPHEKTHRYVQQIKEIEEGWILTSEDVKEDRFKSVLSSAVDFLYSMGEREALKGRLERMAYFLHLQGKGERAAEALHLAVLIGQESREAQSIEFLRGLLARSIVSDIEMHRMMRELGQPTEGKTSEEEEEVEIAEDTVKILRASYFGDS